MGQPVNGGASVRSRRTMQHPARSPLGKAAFDRVVPELVPVFARYKGARRRVGAGDVRPSDAGVIG